MIITEILIKQPGNVQTGCEFKIFNTGEEVHIHRLVNDIYIFF